MGTSLHPEATPGPWLPPADDASESPRLFLLKAKATGFGLNDGQAPCQLRPFIGLFIMHYY